MAFNNHRIARLEAIRNGPLVDYRQALSSISNCESEYTPRRFLFYRTGRNLPVYPDIFVVD